MKLKPGFGFLISCALGVGSAQAHHSFAMFDQEKTATVEGTLYAAEFINPHGWIWIEVKNAAGETEKWGFEGGSVGELRRLGYTRKNLIVGTKVTANYHPLRDGRNGGQLVKLDFGEGKTTR